MRWLSFWRHNQPSTPSMRRADVIAGNAEACTKALIRLTVMYRTGVAIRMGFKATCFHIFIAFMDLRGRRNSRNRQRRQRKTITCIVMSLQSQEGRLAYIASRANVGCQTRQTQRCARKGYMLIVIGARTDYVICATERSRRPHHDNIRTNPVGLARLARDGLYGWVVCQAWIKSIACCKSANG